MHRSILVRVNYGTLLQRASTHLSGIFNGSFSTIEKYTTKSLGLRGTRFPEPTSRLQSNRKETNANVGTKEEEEEETLLIYTAQGSPFRRKKLSVINGSSEQPDNV